MRKPEQSCSGTLQNDRQAGWKLGRKMMGRNMERGALEKRIGIPNPFV
jgi:hypothetical protein